MDPLNLITKKWKEISIVAVLFYLDIVVSFIAYSGSPIAEVILRTEMEYNPIIRLVNMLMYRKYYHMAIQLVFLANLIIVIFIYLSILGFIPGLNLVILLFQAHSLGVYLAGMKLLKDLTTSFRVLLTVALESVSYILVTAAALDVGICLIKPSIIFGKDINRREALLATLSDLGNMYLIAIIFLYLAAVLEILLIMYT